MPKGHYDRSAIQFRRHTFSGPCPWEKPIEPEPFREIPSLSRGEIRLAAEALLAARAHRKPPPEIMERALMIANEMARG